MERSDPEIFATYRREETSADRYNTSKLLEVLMVRELAAQMDAKGGGNPIVLNSLNPGLCRSSLFRHAAFPLNLVSNSQSSFPPFGAHMPSPACFSTSKGIH